MKTQMRLENALGKPTSPEIVAEGMRAKFPVTSSRPRTTIMAKPTGKRIAPTIGGKPWAVDAKAIAVAKPRSAPDEKPRSKSRGIDSFDFTTAVVKKVSATS